MYNLNVNVNATPTSSASLLSVAAAGAEVIPRTPEIVNSLIAMTNPFDGYNQTSTANCSNDNSSGKIRERNDSTSSGEPSPPPSVQHMRSQLIKEGLKLTLQTKRRANSSVDDFTKRAKKEDNSADDEEDDESSNSKTSNELTPEDEERRRRRRERNKIAATKCRLKKREKTVILVQESETLETQNNELKSQIQELETQKRRLTDMLNYHGPNCIKQSNDNQEATYQQYNEPVQPLPSYQENFVPTSMSNQSNHHPHHHHHQHHHPHQHQQQQQQQQQQQLSNINDCAVVGNYVPVKVEDYDGVVGQAYFATTNNPTNAGCPV